jgi:hypothetical protein
VILYIALTLVFVISCAICLYQMWAGTMTIEDLDPLSNSRRPR